MLFDFVVLGSSGMQGRIVSRYLLEQGYSILMCDRLKPVNGGLRLLTSYPKKTKFIGLDVRNVEETADVIQKSGADVVVNCVEGDWNLHVLEACIESKVHSIDLGSEIWMTKKQLRMNKQLRDLGLTHITGCGSVPGIGNIMMKHASKKFDSIDTVEVGFAWTSNMKKFVVPFSMTSITEEFTDSAPVVEDGKMKKVVPMETIEEREFTAIGRQKCFIARHPETYTFYHYFKNKGIKNIRFYAGFPEHSFKTIKTIIDLGLGSQKQIDYDGKMISPIDFLSRILREKEPPKEYRETENLWLKVFGKKNNRRKVIQMECLVPTLDGWESDGCNVDTGIPAGIIAIMIKRGVIKERGSFSPEAVVPTDEFFKELAKNYMIVYENGTAINIEDINLDQNVFIEKVIEMSKEIVI